MRLDTDLRMWWDIYLYTIGHMPRNVWIIPKKAMPQSVQITAQLHSSHILAK